MMNNEKKKISKRFYQLKWIVDSIERKQHIWFYFNISLKRQIYLSGKIKRKRVYIQNICNFTINVMIVLKIKYIMLCK